MLSNRSIQTKIFVGIFIVIGLFVATAIFNYHNLNRIKSDLNLDASQVSNQKSAYEIKNYVGILYSNQADVIINQSDDAAKEYREHAAIYNELIKQLIRNAVTPEEHEWAQQLRKASDSYTHSFESVMDIFNKRHTFSTEKLQEAYKQIDDETDSYKAAIYTLTDQFIARYSEKYNENHIVLDQVIQNSDGDLLFPVSSQSCLALLWPL